MNDKVDNSRTDHIVVANVAVILHPCMDRVLGTGSYFRNARAAVTYADKILRHASNDAAVAILAAAVAVEKIGEAMSTRAMDDLDAIIIEAVDTAKTALSVATPSATDSCIPVSALCWLTEHAGVGGQVKAMGTDVQGRSVVSISSNGACAIVAIADLNPEELSESTICVNRRELRWQDAVEALKAALLPVGDRPVKLEGTDLDDAVVAALKGGEMRTSTEVAAAVGCSGATAYAALVRLARDGCVCMLGPDLFDIYWRVDEERAASMSRARVAIVAMSMGGSV